MELPASENTKAHWGWVAKSFHWIIALIVIGQVIGGFYGHGLLDDLRATGDQSQIDTIRMLFVFHKSTGLVLLVLILARLYWRLTNNIPPLSQELPHALRLGALGVHWAFYVLIIVMSVTGLIFNEHSASHINFYYLGEIPKFFDPGEQAANSAKIVHKVAGYGLAGLMLLHVAAALFHHFVMKDDTLVRMLPAFLGGRHAKS